MDILLVLLFLGIVLFIGFLAEIVFKKTHIPDVIFLLAIGIITGPIFLNWAKPTDIQFFAPLFTTITLLFILYEGGFNIDIHSFIKGAMKSMKITLFNFFISSIIIAIIAYIFQFSILQSLLLGFTLGGISSAFAIPLVKMLKIKKETKSILIFESAFTDVLCIVFAFAIMELIRLNSIDIAHMASSFIMLFLLAGIIGVGAGLFWIFLVAEIFRKRTTMMATIAYVIIAYVFAELSHANGAIAVLFLGLTLQNSEPITRRLLHFFNRDKEIQDIKGIIIVRSHEGLFYGQLSFFLKTFFFVYIGLLFSITDYKILIISGIISIAMMFSRRFSGIITKNFAKYDKEVIMSLFARGLAAAAIAQLTISMKIPNAEIIAQITYTVIIFTMILSAATVFIANKRCLKT